MLWYNTVSRGCIAQFHFPSFFTKPCNTPRRYFPSCDPISHLAQSRVSRHCIFIALYMYYTQVSKEMYHFFIAMLTEIHSIKINHIWTLILNLKHIWKSKGLLLSKRRKMWWSRKRSTFPNITETARREPPRKAACSEHCNGSSFNLSGGLCNHRTGFCPCRASSPKDKQFLWFLKNDLLRLYCILLLFVSSKSLFFKMYLVRRT